MARSHHTKYSLPNLLCFQYQVALNVFRERLFIDRAAPRMWTGPLQTTYVWQYSTPRRRGVFGRKVA